MPLFLADQQTDPFPLPKRRVSYLQVILPQALRMCNVDFLFCRKIGAISHMQEKHGDRGNSIAQFAGKFCGFLL